MDCNPVTSLLSSPFITRCMLQWHRDIYCSPRAHLVDWSTRLNLLKMHDKSLGSLGRLMQIYDNISCSHTCRSTQTNLTEFLQFLVFLWRDVVMNTSHWHAIDYNVSDVRLFFQTGSVYILFNQAFVSTYAWFEFHRWCYNDEQDAIDNPVVLLKMDLPCVNGLKNIPVVIEARSIMKIPTKVCVITIVGKY